MGHFVALVADNVYEAVVDRAVRIHPPGFPVGTDQDAVAVDSELARPCLAVRYVLPYANNRMIRGDLPWSRTAGLEEAAQRRKY